ncbi:hypothetical protein [Persephonella sp.]
MRKKIGVLLTGIFLFSCGGYDSIGLSDDESGEACRYDVVTALDQGNYDYVIQKLSSDITCNGGMTAEEGNINLAAAYVGKAGFTIPDIVNDILKSQVDINLNTSKNYQFDQFLEVLSTKAKASNITLLEKASQAYRSVVDDCTALNLDDIEKDACFYRGLVESARSSISLAFTLENIGSWLDPDPKTCEDINGNSVGDNGDIEACALEYAVNNTCTISGVNLQSMNNNVTFTGGFSYESVKIIVNSTTSGCSNKESYKLIYRSGNIKTVVLTEGYCDTDYNPCSSPDGTTCLPCPVLDANGNPYTVEGTILDAIENAADLMTEIVGDVNADVQQAIDDFRNEVCAAADGDLTTCTTEDLAQYLLSQ